MTPHEKYGWDWKMRDCNESEEIGKLFQEHKELRNELFRLENDAEKLKEKIDIGLLIINESVELEVISEEDGKLVIRRENYVEYQDFEWPTSTETEEIFTGRIKARDRLKEVSQKLDRYDLGDYIRCLDCE